MAIIDRSGAEVQIPEEKSREILQSVPEQSIVMRLMRRLPDMSSKTRSIPVLGSLPMAYFVDGDTGMKQTTSMAWENVKLYAEEIACIVPIPENVLDDSDYDIWGNVSPRMREAIGAAFDKAVLLGTNKPSNFPAGIIPAAVDAGNYLTHMNGGNLYQELMGENGLLALIEADQKEQTFQVAGHRFAVQAAEGVDVSPALAHYAPFAVATDLAKAPVFRLFVVPQGGLPQPDGLTEEFRQDDDGSQIRVCHTPEGDSWFEFSLWGKLSGTMRARPGFGQATLEVADYTDFAVNNAGNLTAFNVNASYG